MYHLFYYILHTILVLIWFNHNRYGVPQHLLYVDNNFIIIYLFCYGYIGYKVVEIQHELSTVMKFEVIFLGVPILLPTTTLPVFELKLEVSSSVLLFLKRYPIAGVKRFRRSVFLDH